MTASSELRGESAGLVERVAQAIASADERNGAPPYAQRMAMGKHVREQLYDEARAACEAFRQWQEEGKS